MDNLFFSGQIMLIPQQEDLTKSAGQSNLSYGYGGMLYRYVSEEKSNTKQYVKIYFQG